MSRIFFKCTLLAFFLASVLGLFGCRHTESEKQESESSDSLNVINSLDKENLQKGNVTDVAKPNSAMLLFDASISMKGYLTSSQDSRFRGVISSFLTEILSLKKL